MKEKSELAAIIKFKSMSVSGISGNGFSGNGISGNGLDVDNVQFQELLEKNILDLCN